MSSVAQPASGANPLAVLTTASKYVPTDADLLKAYNDGFYSTIFKFILVTAIQIVILVWTLMGGGIADILNNWPKYRCNPIIMPFAGLFGFDAGENFNFCMKNIFSMNAGAVLAPVYGVMSNFTDIVGTISNVANSFRYLIANLLSGMERLMGSFRDRFQFILFSIRMSFFKIMNMMGRLYATFYAVIFMGMSGLQAANNVANNDMVKFLLEFCFDPETPIKLSTGVIIPIKSLKIGDKLEPVNGNIPVVTSLFTFDGSKTPMVEVGGVCVSAKHYIRYDSLDTMIEAGDHPDAKAVPSINRLICLNTSTHNLMINKMLFADYDESEEADVIKVTQRLAENSLNSGVSKKATSDYNLGLGLDTEIRVLGGTFVKLRDIQVGEILCDGGIVKGVVRENIYNIAILDDGVKVSEAQLVWNIRSKSWVRACYLYKQIKSEEVFGHLITTGSVIEGRNYFFRDYREVSSPEMEDAYADAIKKIDI
jgi:hypothetical protein